MYPGSEFLGLYDPRQSLNDIKLASKKADIIYVMEEKHLASYRRDYPAFVDKIKILGVPDMFSGDCMRLREWIRRKVEAYEVNWDD